MSQSPYPGHWRTSPNRKWYPTVGGSRHKKAEQTERNNADAISKNKKHGFCYGMLLFVTFALVNKNAHAHATEDMFDDAEK